ncbi:glycosyltransferase family 39 protein [Sphaerisporangium flaviroseum]|uniref:Glycosyltransferase family 39 protein n=1 Tax=Sphaerisporangium flaviroseum TaxID=509199 RepID=A0ABP7HAI4_9ACTN
MIRRHVDGAGTSSSALAEPRAVPPPAADRRRTRRALAAWAGLIVSAFAAGAVLHGLGVLTIDHLPPLHAHFRVLTITLLPAAVLAAAAVIVLPDLLARGGFGRALLLAYGCALAWTILLALSGDGPAEPLTHQTEYLAVLPAVGDDPLGWLASFTERLGGYPTHVRGHPPLPVLILWGLARLGMPGALPASLLVITVACSATVAIGLTVRTLAGEDAARRALPYLALTPSAVWIATSMDALFAGVGAWGVALLVLPCRGRSGPAARARVLCGVAAGALLGALPYLSYGLVPYLLIPLVAGMVARVPKATVFAALFGAAAVTAAFAAGGFLWPAGVLATHAQWAADAGAARPYLYFLVANMGVLALMSGPATAAGLVRAGSRPVGAMVAAALVAVLALDLSGVTRGEVERIWVPYALWVGLAAGAVPGRRWLAAQVVTGLLLQSLVLSPW